MKVELFAFHEYMLLVGEAIVELYTEVAGFRLKWNAFGSVKKGLVSVWAKTKVKMG